MGMPAVVWHSCGNNFGYRIPWAELMASGIWPWGADMHLLYPRQKFIWLVCRKVLARYDLRVGQVNPAYDINVPVGCVHVECIEYFVNHGTLDMPALIAQLLKAWSAVADDAASEGEVAHVPS